MMEPFCLFFCPHTYYPLWLTWAPHHFSWTSKQLNETEIEETQWLHVGPSIRFIIRFRPKISNSFLKSHKEVLIIKYSHFTTLVSFPKKGFFLFSYKRSLYPGFLKCLCKSLSEKRKAPWLGLIHRLQSCKGLNR